MPRQKHGQYDQAKHLPDNVGQAQGSGIIVWFHERICLALGEDAGQALIAESRTHGSQNRAWLCAQLTERGHAELVAAYQERRRKEDAAERRREKERQIAMCEATIASNTTPPAHQAFLRKRIEQMQKYLETHGG